MPKQSINNTLKYIFKYKFFSPQKSNKFFIQMHHPGSRQQLEEVWEEQDHLSPDSFNPKTFFQLHGPYGNTLSHLLIISGATVFKLLTYPLQIWMEMVFGILTKSKLSLSRSWTKRMIRMPLKMTWLNATRKWNGCASMYSMKRILTGIT